MKKKVLIIAHRKSTTSYKYPPALKKVGIEPIMAHEFSNPEEFDGLLIAGGNDIDPHLYGEENNGSKDTDIIYDKECIKEIEAFLSLNKPIFGICRGLQLLNVFFKGTLNQDIKTHHKVNHYTSIVNPSFLSECYNGKNKIYVNSIHHQSIKVLGENLKVVSTSDDGEIEAIENLNKKIIAVQWHPERMIDNDSYPSNGLEIFKYFKNML